LNETDTGSSGHKEAVMERGRNGERPLREVLRLLKQWRCSEGKLSLTEKSKELNVSKKTLDDYHIYCKEAKFLGYDFEKHLDTLIGHMKAFCRKNRKK